ncbi:MAG TPA: hypothetical protein VGM12_21755 [Trebonia sp.]
MERNRRRMLTGLAVTGVLAGALAGGGVALASTGGAAQPASVAAAVAPAANTGTPTAAPGAAGKGGTRFLRRHHAGRLVLRTAASYLGVTQAELLTQLHAGRSLSAVATAQGRSVSGLENAILAAVTKRIDASDRSAARKAALTGDVKNNLNAFVTMAHPFEWAAHKLGKAAAAASAPAPASASASAAAAA